MNTPLDDIPIIDLEGEGQTINGFKVYSSDKNLTIEKLNQESKSANVELFAGIAFFVALFFGFLALKGINTDGFGGKAIFNLIPCVGILAFGIYLIWKSKRVEVRFDFSDAFLTTYSRSGKKVNVTAREDIQSIHVKRFVLEGSSPALKRIRYLFFVSLQAKNVTKIKDLRDLFAMENAKQSFYTIIGRPRKEDLEPMVDDAWLIAQMISNHWNVSLKEEMTIQS
ncbi:MAG: hypothetical protein QNK23_14125 [Crocinitomicaceae bacterium]|nr:hypothetical protein [Crocinitomicaceae bacterium]